MRDRICFKRSDNGKEWIAYLQNHPEVSAQARKKAEAAGYLILLFKDRIEIIVKGQKAIREMREIIVNYHWCAAWQTPSILHHFLFDAKSVEEANITVNDWCMGKCEITKDARIERIEQCWNVTWLDDKGRKHWLLMLGPATVEEARQAARAWTKSRKENIVNAHINGVDMTLLDEFHSAAGEPFYPEQRGHE